MKSTRPLLKGFIRHDNKVTTISVWCPFCKCFHLHGWPTGLSASERRYGSHRYAHCSNPESPFREGGYFLKPFTKKEVGAV